MNNRIKTVLALALAAGGALAGSLAGAQEPVRPECPAKSATTTDLETVRQQLMTASTSPGVLEFINRCFPDNTVPACLAPLRDVAEQQRVVNASQFDSPLAYEPRRQPPAELLDAFDTSDWSFQLRENVEQIARDKGWPVVRYKSRHSGGFDQETPSLLMIRVPGATLDPPVSYDRYLNIALPADDVEHAVDPTPQVPFPSAVDYKAEALGTKVMPRVFTIVSLERPTANARAKVYFQMFRRAGARGDSRFSPTRTIDVKQCIGCHSNGLRAISPLGYHVRAGEPQMDPAEWLKVDEMNLAMERDEKTGLRFSAPDWRGATGPAGDGAKFFVSEGAGPIYGPFEPLSTKTVTNSNGDPVTTHPTRTKDFIVGADGASGCANSQTAWSMVDIFQRPPGLHNIYTMNKQRPVRWQKIRDAMKCSECHDNNARGAFNSFTEFPQIAYKVLVDQSMPPDAHKDPMEQLDPVTKQRSPTKAVVDTLTGDERIALVNCLRAEYQQQERSQMDAWLKRKSCDR